MMWDKVLTRLELGIHNESIVWTLGSRPTKMLNLVMYDRLAPAVALGFLGELERSHDLDRVLALHSTGDLSPHVSMMQRTEQLRRLITDGRLVAWRGFPAMVVQGESGKPGEVSYSYTKSKMTPVYIGHEVARKPANLLTGEPAQDVPVAVFAGTGYAAEKGLPDETDATCPSDNHRSESTTTCSPAVNQWFADKQVPEEFRNSSLGIVGGGGFVRSKTTVKHLPAGTPLYRYVNYATKPWGGWWFLKPLDGNPCAMAALPANSAASVMVQARLKRGIDVLYGPGAPRCSNKPGGPEQVLVALCDFHPSQNDVLDIVG